MKYERIQKGVFIERPNRFIAHIEIEGSVEIVHVKNTGRCAELLIPGTVVYVQKAANPLRKTQWDLIAVEKEKRIVNMDSQITNYVVKEWIEQGNLFADITLLKTEVTYKKSRFDLYVEADGKKIFIEVKGVTLENEGVVKFPDAPSDRAVKHVNELVEAKKEGYEVYVFFVVQMKDVLYFTPNEVTHKAFAETLIEADKQGVHVVAYDCNVEGNSIVLRNQVPVVLEYPVLHEMVAPLVEWYHCHKRDLPWRRNVSAYEIWVSEIMLQQTRVEAVKPYYKRFLEALPSIEDLAVVEEEKLLKLWEGLGYYNRVRNMQLAARQVMEEHDGLFPGDYHQILNLKGIGNYTAGAIASIAFGIQKPAVDGNVLRVMARLLGDDGDIMKASVRKEMELRLEKVVPEESAGDFNQSLIELGATVCVPNGAPKCEVCPLACWCRAKADNRIEELPVRTKLKSRKIEQRTVLIYKDGEKIAIKKRKSKGLLAGLYELPNVEGHLSVEEVVAYSKDIGLMPIKVDVRASAKHIFSHIEWQMIGYEVRVDELEKTCQKDMIFIEPEEVEEQYPIPAAFSAYTEYLDIKLGQSAYEM